MFQAVDDGATDDLKKLLTCKRYGEVRDRCGRNVLHRAILKRREPMVTYLMTEFPNIINGRDSVCIIFKTISSANVIEFLNL